MNLYKAWRKCGYGRWYCLKGQIRDWFWQFKYTYNHWRFCRSVQKDPVAALKALKELADGLNRKDQDEEGTRKENTRTDN